MPKQIFDIKTECDFEKRVLNSKNAVMVGFFSPWCESCKIKIPKLERVIEENEEDVAMAKVNIDELQDLEHKNNISNVPSIAVNKNGQVQSTLDGMQEIDDIRKFVDDNNDK
ncbi:hypothetical protein PVAND_017495 [Polypedilum vanderplanki]|uniref:Thioredoxin n=1 Tax=Polypedilum vanderplanki TaxID=319348 RepID=A0A9J6BIS3_POLVA|nr:hypothetical protein PVAND_017495 [Polypedilum vanderplanki]